MNRFSKYILQFTCVLTLGIVQAGWANTATGIIQGIVIDAETHKPLPGVNIFVEHTTIGAATDRDGIYLITKIPVGEVHLVASMMGYKLERKIIEVVSGQKIRVDFELKSTILEMGAIVITGTATPHLVEDMPVRTEVIPRRRIEQKQACNLAEALSFHTGIRVENNCQNCNFTQVRILGMDGKYSQILIDGDPVVSSLAGVYGLEHFPEEMVDQIEIVKGSGSSLYGAGAVAGVVNMITRRPIINQVRIRYLGNATNGEMDQHLGAVAETVNEKGTSGAYVFGSFRTRNPYDHNGDGFSELGQLRNESIGFKWYYKPLETGELLTSFHRIHDERRGGNKFDLPAHEAEIAEWIAHWRSGGTVRWSHRPFALFDYRIYYSFSVENRESYYGGLGGDTNQDRLDALAFYGKTDVDALYINTGIFLQDNIHFGAEDEIEFVLGVRMDKHSELNNWIYSPRINGKFNIWKGFTLRGAFTTGFKPPQTYDEDLHLCGIEGDQRVIRNAPDLKEERSNSMSVGIEFQGYVNTIPMMVSLTGFKIRLEDAFTEEFVAKEGVIERWERINSDGAGVKGVEIDLGIRPVTMIEVLGGFTYTNGEYDSPLVDFGTKKFLRTPELTGNINLTFNLADWLDLYVRGNYIGKADVPHEVVIEGQEDPELRLERSESFFQIDLGLTYRFPVNTGLNAKLNMGIKNLTNAYQKDLDKGPDRDPAYVYGPIRPRTIYVGFETAF
jgi:outer membrane receptor for ferrienterochelin and colicins